MKNKIFSISSSYWKYFKIPKYMTIEINSSEFSVFSIKVYPALFRIHFLFLQINFWYKKPLTDEEEELQRKRQEIQFQHDTMEKTECIINKIIPELKEQLNVKEVFMSVQSFDFSTIVDDKIETSFSFRMLFDMNNNAIPIEVKQWMQKILDEEKNESIR
jgi:hypothetical protein